MSSRKQAIFENSKYLPFLALTAVAAWGCAYPLIKLGMREFMIAADNTGGKTLFAGVRFTMAGLIVLLIAAMQRRKAGISRKQDVILLLLFAFVNTTLHYFCFYIGMSNSFGSRASVLDSLGTFFLVVMACIVFKDEHMTVKKALGCALGIAGVLLINVGGARGGHFTFEGDGMIILNALFAAAGGILTRIITRKMDALMVTGVGLGAGGLMLCFAGLVMGGNIPHVSAAGIFILILLIGVSAIGFSIYNQLFRYHPVGKVAIYNSLIPLFGIVLSCLFLGEEFRLNYLAAGLLAAAGVYIINRC